MHGRPPASDGHKRDPMTRGPSPASPDRAGSLGAAAQGVVRVGPPMSRLVLIALWLTLGAGLVYAFGTAFARPVETVEGEILFEAQRVRDHFALYIDPVVGAYDYGAVPSRYRVLYTPLWPYVLARLPGAMALASTRVASALGWYGLLAVIAFGAAPERRHAAVAAAACAGGTFMLVRHCATATADSVAVVVAGSALLRTLRVGRADAFAGALFALAAWTKPNVVGLAAGVLLHEIFVGRSRSLKPLAAGIAVSGALGFWTYRVSHGAWLEHLLRSTLQPATLQRALHELAPRLPFLGLPHGFAAWCAARARPSFSTSVLRWALASSLIWTAIEMGKVGSSTAYWLEPTVAAVTTMAHVPISRVRLWDLAVTRWLVALVALAIIACNAAASGKGAREAFVRRDAIARVRGECGARASDLVLADHPGLEMMLDDRVLETPFQLTHLVREGRYPLALWKSDVAAPQIRCLVTETDLRDPAPAAADLENERFGPEIRPALLSRFELVTQDSGLWIYRARGP
jgi:hypothetical protein